MAGRLDLWAIKLFWLDVLFLGRFLVKLRRQDHFRAGGVLVEFSMRLIPDFHAGESGVLAVDFELGLRVDLQHALAFLFLHLTHSTVRHIAAQWDESKT